MELRLSGMVRVSGCLFYRFLDFFETAGQEHDILLSCLV